MTCHFNSSQKTIAERLLNILRTRGGTYFKYTDIQYSTVDKLISKTKILYVSVIIVPKNMTCHFNLRHIISVHVSALFKKTFHHEINQRKNVDVQWGTDSTVYRKYPSLARNQDDQCSSPDTADHPSDTPRLLLLLYLVRQILGHDGRKHKTIENRKAGKIQRTKPKKQRAEDISQKLTSLFLGGPCRTACFVGLTTRSSVAGGL